jgi:hypothetical protein
MDDICIVDIIDHTTSVCVQRMLVLDRMPVFAYEKRGIWLIGHDSGFFGFYVYERPGPTWKAFGGAKFDIPMVDGSVTKAVGQWWDACPADYSDIVYAHGIGTTEDLSRCNVFIQSRQNRNIVDAWLAEHEPSNNFHKHDARHADFGKHTIKSKWETA